MTSTIKLNHVSKNYDQQLPILNQINYTFQAKKFYGIIGASGSGKTTLLNLLGTLDKATSGEIFILDTPIKQMSTKEKAKLRNQHIGFIFQSFFLNHHLTAIENVMLPMLIINQSFKQCQQKAEMLLSEIGLAHRLNALPKQLSGGEQQRVAIARALANDPDILLADELTGNLDADTEANIVQIFQNIARNKNKTVIMVTHNLALCQKVDQLLILEKGSLHALPNLEE